MANANEVFNALIRAEDGSSPVLNRITDLYAKLGLQIKSTEHNVDEYRGKLREVHAEHEGLLHRMGEHVEGLKENWKGVGESLAQVVEHATELVPALATLGAAGSIAGIFETVNRTAERFGELSHSAEMLGTNVRQLQLLQGAAKLADVNIENLQKSAGKLNQVMGEASLGHNKLAMSLFKHLHLDPRRLPDAVDALPIVAEQLMKEKSVKVRTVEARLLMGRGGADLLPLLPKIEEGYKEAAKLMPDFGKHGEDIESYNHTRIGLDLATQGFMDSLGMKLSPALEPLLAKLRDTVAEHREEITDKVSAGVLHLADAVKDADWSKIIKDVDDAATSVGHLADNFSLLEHSAEAVAGLFGLGVAFKLAKPVIETGKLGMKVAGAGGTLGGELWGMWEGAAAWARKSAAEEIGAGRGAVRRIPKVTTASTAEGLSDLAERQAGLAGRVRDMMSETSPSVLGRFGRVAKGVGGVALGPEIGALIGAHEAGMFAGDLIDKYIPGAASVDDWFARHTDGWVGRSYESLGIERPQELPGHTLAPSFLRVVENLDKIRSVSIPASIGRFSDQHDIGLSDVATGGQLRGGTLPLWPDEGLRSSDGRTASPTRSDTAEVRIRIDIPNLPSDARVETDIRGKVGDVQTNLGRAWNDLYP